MRSHTLNSPRLATVYPSHANCSCTVIVTVLDHSHAHAVLLISHTFAKNTNKKMSYVNAEQLAIVNLLPLLFKLSLDILMT